ncbi:hypothetical protein Fuma_01699 [Fuerstiella marisgermanici]|uniref:Uncharacterized protein n=1 Tax=Fuerstiella marisgermanici TaxID=1891926 RepID=A0A1P8WDE1_9PLAN|nr:hypothetical protein Fuma_01699 [Fuerstiella marisgermanici]
MNRLLADSCSSLMSAGRLQIPSQPQAREGADERSDVRGRA